jgi:flagellar protein FliL
MFKKKSLASAAGAAGAAAPDGAMPSGPRWRSKVLALAGLGLLSLVALIVGLFAALGSSGVTALLWGDPAEAAIIADTSHDGTPPPPHGAALVVMPFEEMIVNISATTESGRQTSRFLKVDLALVYDRKQDPEAAVETRYVFLRDAFQDYLRQLADRDLEGTHGLVTVKGELLRRARAIAGSDAPHELLITGLVIQ